ncbi:MAG: hypothetical protein PSV13_07550 [Lacunisphaera sp.]|nr:hypothetical protein [Lacunisphaera sp.]
MNHSSSQLSAGLWAGAATINISPEGPTFLYGYPHVRRYSTGVHDPLECAALFLRSKSANALLLANDLIFVSNALVREVRQRLAEATGIAEEAILIGATHTHSGPIVSDQVSNEGDPVVPKADPRYLAWLADRLVEAGRSAVTAAEPAELGWSMGRAEGVGNNRHDPKGATDSEVPVLVVRSPTSREPLACLLVYGMHPTVLHEDSTLISADFPHFTRHFLRERVLPAACPVLYFNGASGNQSPRHMIRSNTFAEARRIGENLGRAVAEAIDGISYGREVEISFRNRQVKLEPRVFPSGPVAAEGLVAARTQFARLKKAGAAPAVIRTAECDVFGAEETVELVRAAADGRVASTIARCTPAEIQAITIGPWTLVAWPGEFFAEYGLALKEKAPRACLVTLANGELQGYIVTPEAAERGCYEAMNTIYSVDNGRRFVETTLALLAGARGTPPR